MPSGQVLGSPPGDSALAAQQAAPPLHQALSPCTCMRKHRCQACGLMVMRTCGLPRELAYDRSSSSRFHKGVKHSCHSCMHAVDAAVTTRLIAGSTSPVMAIGMCNLDTKSCLQDFNPPF